MNKVLRSLLFVPIFVLSLITGLGFAQSQASDANSRSLTDQVDKVFEPYDKPGSPGCALAVIKDGAILYKRGFGMADLESAMPITPSTIFHIGSVSKQFTAMAIQLLVQEGKLSLDDDARKFLPELHNFGKTITIRHLLHHTSGLREQLQLLFMAGWRLEDVVTQEDILRLVWQQRELNFEPGAEHLYSNTNYTLLALIVERVSGKPLAQYAEERIFKPLGMVNTRFRDDYRMVTKNLALSYIQTSQGIKHMFLLGSYVGAAGLMTTVEDLALWDQNFYTPRVGGREVVERMVAKGRLNNGLEIHYASGLNVGQYRGLKTVEHSGEDAGYQGNFLQFPEQRFSVVVLSNSGSFDAVDTARRVAELYLKNEIKTASLSQPAPTPPPALTEIRIAPNLLSAYVGDYKLSFGIPLKLSRESDRLAAQVRTQPKQPLLAVSATEFATKDGSIRIRFLPPEQGKYLKLEMHLEGQRLDGERVETLSLTDAAAKAYIGTYYSEELRAVYSVSYENGGLRLRHRRGEEPLTLKHKDQFTTGFSPEARLWRGGEYTRIVFQRDRRNRVVSFLLSMPTARNLRFIGSEFLSGRSRTKG